MQGKSTLEEHKHTRTSGLLRAIHQRCKLIKSLRTELKELCGIHRLGPQVVLSAVFPDQSDQQKPRLTAEDKLKFA